MSERIERLNSLVQQQVADIIQREVEFPPDTLVTVTRARVADDAESAKVWLSVLPFDNGQSVLAAIQKHIVDIQHILNKRLVMKFVPKLYFALDTTADKADHVSHVLDTLTDEDLGK